MAAQISERRHTSLPFAIFLLLLKKEKNCLDTCTHMCVSVCAHASPSLIKPSLSFLLFLFLRPQRAKESLSSHLEKACQAATSPAL